ncbi:MAG: type 4a pilus biogenesis protein PilO [Planctomycetes bacterium]|nr:type 4a pilus biogenesis protein PilO [Planctomycetota bacterium]
MHKLSEKQLLILTLGVGLLFALLGGGAIWYIENNMLKPIEDDLLKVSESCKTEKAKVDQIEKLKSDEKNSETEMAKVREMLPTVKESPLEDFYEMISTLGQQCEVEVGNLGYTPGPTKQGAVFESQIWTVQLRGGFFELLTFIYKLETMKRFIKVNTFGFSGGTLTDPSGGPSKRIFGLSVKLTSYTFPEAAPPPAK